MIAATVVYLCTSCLFIIPFASASLVLLVLGLEAVSSSIYVVKSSYVISLKGNNKM